ncbi:MAG: hypothetical protein AAGI63_18625 [Planctomycetota bacterium]
MNKMFDPSESRNNELLVDVGRRGHFPPSERMDLGTHYDLIDHLWQHCNARLEQDCRWIVAFLPALVQPTTGVAFAIAIGTNYFIRILEPYRKQYAADLRQKAFADAQRLGVEQDNLDSYLERRSGNSGIGPSWATGWFLPNEADYILHACEQCG